MDRLHFVLGLLVISLLVAALVKLAMCCLTGHWCDWWAILAGVFVLRLFPWPWAKRKRGRGIFIRL